MLSVHIDTTYFTLNKFTFWKRKPGETYIGPHTNPPLLILFHFLLTEEKEEGSLDLSLRFPTLWKNIYQNAYHLSAPWTKKWRRQEKEDKTELREENRIRKLTKLKRKITQNILDKEAKEIKYSSLVYGIKSWNKTVTSAVVTSLPRFKRSNHISHFSWEKCQRHIVSSKWDRRYCHNHLLKI